MRIIENTNKLQESEFKHKPVTEKSLINFRRAGGKGVKLDFTKETNGTGLIHLYYAGNFVKTIRINLTRDMEA